MAPSRKSRSVNKQFSYTNEAASNKCGENANKTGQKKRKLSDMLGPQWTKEELENFYEAYRKYGKDWKKVASVVRHRSVEMVETLYSMNKAYLSLPEGVASVVGLIAMMTDHYYILGGSDSEQENNEDAETFRKPQKHAGSKLRIVQMSNLIRSRKAVTTAQSSPLPAQQSAAIALAQMNHLPVGPAVSHAPASSASSVAQPVSARRRHRPPSTTDTTSTSSTGASGSQLGSRSLLYMMEARRRGGSKFPEIDVFGDVYVQPGNELAKSLHTTMMEKSQLVLQESASQLPPDTPLEFVDPPQDARFQILTKTLDQTLGRQPGTYCRGMGNPRRREPRAHSSSQSNSLVNALTARVTALTTQMAELETKMSQFLQSLVRSGIPIPHFGPSLTSEPLQLEHGHHTSAPVKNVQTSELHL